MLAPQRGRGKQRPLTRPRPSATLSPRRGCGLLGAPPHTLIIALSLGERGDRKAEGAPRFAGCGGEGSFPNARHPSRNLLPELSNFYCLPGRAGGSPYGLGLRFCAVAFVALESTPQLLLQLLVVFLDGQIERLMCGLYGLGGTASLVIGVSQRGEAPPIFAFAKLHALLKSAYGPSEVPA